MTVNVNRSPAMLIMLVGGVLMLIDTFLAWQSVDVGPITFTRNAWHGFFGVLVGLLSIVFLVNAVAQAGFAQIKLPVPHKLVAIVVAPAILISALIKNLDDDYSGWASYVGIVIAAAITYGAWMMWNEKSMPEAASAGGSAPPAPPAPPPSGGDS